ncbi:hypothetical protein MMC26_004660 [Xylographa opegraphella]|nr:hypothetical protein [Xylographa opegraphella]
MKTYNLPTSRTLITSLFDSFPSTAPTSPLSPSNLLSTATDATKTLFITLHCLFPSELLPALDLLDRRLITRLIYQSTPTVGAPAERGSEKSEEAQPSDITVCTIGAKDIKVYYVRSAQSTRSASRYQSIPGSATSYEVRINAWNCSCAAFTFSAFNGMGANVQGHEDGTNGIDSKKLWFGGLTRGRDSIPVCKHLLACVLVERSGLFEELLDERTVGQEETAGWAAGWGG